VSTTKRLRPLAVPKPSAYPILTANPQSIDVLDRLRKLGALRTIGLLTRDEYEAKRLELRTFLRNLRNPR
jgi:hypothetical protein